MIGIIDLGINNIGSLQNALKNLEVNFETIKSKSNLESFSHLILPGVGSFDSGVHALEKADLFDSLKKLDFENTKILGICLGMQLLCKDSEEGSKKGLGLIDLNVKNLGNLGCNEKIPHVGFNEVSHCEDDGFFKDLVYKKDFYFIHSYGASKRDIKNLKYSSVQYGTINIISTIKLNNIFATQFHPEKSGILGLKILKKFCTC
tara:strand:+ start:4209 stop:4820 length:612 start_codon:yes stop_codon:yes gene_type:complete